MTGLLHFTRDSNMKTRFVLFPLALILLAACSTGTRPDGDLPAPAPATLPFAWENATVYFLLTDRFYNGDPANDRSFGRQPDGDTLRYFMGGDLKGITRKIESGYFTDLGVNAIWMTPIFENIRGFTDEGTGKTYAYHGYWIRDWTSLDPNFGTEQDLLEMVETAHRHGIRILLDAVANHTGPVTTEDGQWPDDWVRTGPLCDYTDFAGTVECTLVRNLPDIRTEDKNPVELPAFLLDKWHAEGRLEQELAELDAFFGRTGFPRAPRYYLIKWLCDWVRQYGIDGFRVDTAKHTEADLWEELAGEARTALREWKQKNPGSKLDDLDFWMVGEVYNYSIGNGRNYDYGDRQVDFFENGFESLINFQFKYDVRNSPDSVFAAYAGILNGGALSGKTVLNYLSSHDDSNPYDPDRQHPLETGTMLLLSPGAAQIYYGDETARLLTVEGAVGDANLRSFMNWEDLLSGASRSGIGIHDVLEHWQRLGRFRREHLAVGAGRHEQVQPDPYVFRRSYDRDGQADRVLVGLGLPEGEKTLSASGTFGDGTELWEYYSGQKVKVRRGEVRFESPYTLALLGLRAGS
jgi:alpha-amylase